MTLDLSLTTPHLKINASAGTGKTHQLTRRFIALLADNHHQHNNVTNILATTFTRKAAGEMLDRVLLELAKAANDRDHAKALATDIQSPDPTHQIPFNQQIASRLLTQLLHHLHRMRICTLDSFFAQLAKGFSLELGLPPGWRMIEEHELEQFRLDAISQILPDAFADLADSPHQGLHTLMHLLTKGQTSRSIHNQINTVVKSLHELYIESPHEAWFALKPPPGKLKDDQLAIAIEQLAEASPHLPTKKDGNPTSNSLKAHAKAIESANAQDWLQFLDSGIAKKIAANEDTYDRRPITSDLISAYAPILHHARSVLLTRIIDQTKATYHLLHHFDQAFSNIKHRARALHFSDVTRKLAHITNPEILFTLFYRLDGQIQHYLFDEFQDTSLQQWQILQPLVDEASATTDGSHSIFVVGDTKQAIYAWRGGVAEIIDHIHDVAPNTAEVELSTSYRSRPAIIQAVNELFLNLPANLYPDKPAAQNELDTFTQNFPHHTPTPFTETPGHVTLSTIGSTDYSKNENTHEAFRHTAHLIQQITQSMPNATIGVLLRNNAGISQLMHMLRQLDPPIEASDEAGIQLHLIPAVSAILSFIQLIDHPQDSVAAFHIATSPLAHVLNFHNYTDTQHARQLATDYRQKLIEQGYGPTLHQLIKQLAEHITPNELHHLNQLVELAHQYQPYATLRPADFARYVQQTRVEDPSAARVRIMTIHKSKGLQFDIVILPELDIKLFGQAPNTLQYRETPLSSPAAIIRYLNTDLANLAKTLPDLGPTVQQMTDQYEAGNIRESLNLLYVALTRAKYALHMLIPPPTLKKNGDYSITKTFASLIRMALAPDIAPEADTVLYDEGDPNWYPQSAIAKQNPTPTPTSTPTSTTHPPLDIHPINLPKANRKRALVRQSPSQLAHSQHINLADIFTLTGKSAREFGDHIHQLFEHIEWLDPAELPSLEDLAQITQNALADAPLTAEQRDALTEKFHTMLQVPEITQSLSKENYAHLKPHDLQIYNEMPFILRTPTSILNGRCDRVVIAYDTNQTPFAADIVDFKTDAIPADSPNAISERVEKYTPQLRAYVDAVARRFQLDSANITTHLLFVTAGKVVYVPHNELK